MKKIVLLALAVVMSAGLRAQNIEETTVKYNELIIPAYTLTFTQDKELVTEAFQQRLKESNVKAIKTNGYLAVVNQTFDVIYPQPVDFYAKIEEQGRKKERTTVVTFFAKSPNLTISQSELNINVRHLLESFSLYVSRFEAQQKMGQEEKTLAKAQKTQAKAEAAVASIDKDIESVQDKIARKEAEIEKYKEKIAECQQEIEKLKANIDVHQDKKVAAEKKVEDAKGAVQSSESEVERFRQQANQ